MHDNATAHRALATQKKLAYLGLQCLYYPPLYDGSGPIRLPTIPWAKNYLKGNHFLSDEEVIAAAETWLDGKISSFFFEWLAKVRTKC